jgi:hypothetical protein
MKRLLLLLPMLVFGAQQTDIVSTPSNETLTTPAPTVATQNNTAGCSITNITKKNCLLRLEVTGVGVVPCNGACSTAQAKVMARRAAIVDGYKALSEKLYGIKINGRDTVKNMILQNSSIRAYVSGLIRGANIEEEDFKDGVYSVVMSIKINVKEWNKFIKNNGLYMNSDYDYAN